MCTAGLQFPQSGKQRGVDTFLRIPQRAKCPPPTYIHLLGQVSLAGTSASAQPAISRLLEVSMKSQQKHHWKCSSGTRHTVCTYHPAVCKTQGFPVQPLLLGKRTRRETFRPLRRHIVAAHRLSTAHKLTTVQSTRTSQLDSHYSCLWGWEAGRGVAVVPGSRAGPATTLLCDLGSHATSLTSLSSSGKRASWCLPCLCGSCWNLASKQSCTCTLRAVM